MALSEQVVIDKIEVVENGSVQVREVTRIIKDGEQIAQTYHRSSFNPGSDVSSQPDNVKAICAAAWTPAVISAWNAEQERIAAEREAQRIAAEEAEAARLAAEQEAAQASAE